MKTVQALFFSMIFSFSIAHGAVQTSYFYASTSELTAFLQIETSFWLDLKNWTKIKTTGD